MALLVGGLVGYLAGQPQRNDLADQKKAVEAELASTKTSLDQVQSDLDSTKADLAAAGMAADAAETCRRAADDADALINDWVDVSGDIDAWWASVPGSQEEADLGQKINDKLTAMDAEDEKVQQELEDCRSAMRQV